MSAVPSFYSRQVSLESHVSLVEEIVWLLVGKIVLPNTTEQGLPFGRHRLNYLVRQIHLMVLYLACIVTVQNGYSVMLVRVPGHTDVCSIFSKNNY